MGEHKQRIKEQKEFEQKIQPKREHIRFGETNERPPVDLHKLGSKLFGKKVNNPNDRNANHVNVGGLSFAKVIKDRAEEMKKQEIMSNYQKLKQKRNAQNKRQAKKWKKAKRKVW